MTARTQTRHLGTGSETVGTAWPGLLCRMAVSPPVDHDVEHGGSSQHDWAQLAAGSKRNGRKEVLLGGHLL